MCHPSYPSCPCALAAPTHDNTIHHVNNGPDIIISKPTQHILFKNAETYPLQPAAPKVKLVRLDIAAGPGPTRRGNADAIIHRALL
eukprot:9108044-Pyramimonas_sp.AAC.1